MWHDVKLLGTLTHGRGIARNPSHQVDAIRKLDVVKNRDVHASRQLLFFAYALTMKGVTRELEYLGHTLQDAFGVIGQSTEEFDVLFEEGVRSDRLEGSGLWV